MNARHFFSDLRIIIKSFVFLHLLFVFCSNIGLSQSQSTTPILRLNPDFHYSIIYKINVDTKKQRILTVSLDNTAKIWDANTGELLKTIRVPIYDELQDKLGAGAISPDGSTVAFGGNMKCGGSYHYFYVYDLINNQYIKKIGTLADKAVLDLEYSLDGRYLAVAFGGTKGVVIYSADGYEIVKKLEGYSGRTSNIAWDYAGGLASVSFDGKLRLYDSSFKLIKEVQLTGGNQPYSVAFSPDGTLLAIGYVDTYKIQVFSSENLQLLYEPDISYTTDNGRGLYVVSFSSDNQYLIAGGLNQKEVNEKWWCHIRIWDDKGRGAYRDVPAGSDVTTDIKPLKEGNFVYSTNYPDMGVISTNGEVKYHHIAETNSYGATDVSHLKVDHNATKLGVTPYGKEPLTFDIISRQLTVSEFLLGKIFSDTARGIEMTDWHLSYTPKLNGKNLSFLKEYERSQCVDVTEDGGSIVFGTQWHMYRLNSRGETIWRKIQPAETWCVNTSGNGRFIVTGLSDGTIRWYSMENGALLMSLYLHPDNSRWVLWSPEGYFDCSAGAESLIGWHVNRGEDKEPAFYPASQFYDKYYTPNLGAKILSGESYIDTREEDVISNFTHPPLVKISSPQNGSILTNEQLTVTMSVTDKGGGIDEIRLYHNGKLIDGTQRGFKHVSGEGATETKTFTFSLVDGENRIRATAYNIQRTESIPHEIVVHYKASVLVKPDMYILAIGINEYLNPRYNLNYAKNDADAFVNALQSGAADIFNRVNVQTLNDSKATRSGILTEVENIKSQARAEDVFVFYYAGHGVMSIGSDVEKPEFYLVPHNVTKMYEADDMLKAKGISAKEIGEFSKGIRSQKQLFVLDACQSGGAVQSFAMRGVAEEKAIAQLSRSTGTYFIAASGSEQFATEVETLGHGVFTYSVIQAFKGACGSQGGRLTVNLLKGCVEDLVPELSKEYKGQPQFPTGYGFGQDFPIVIVK